MLTSDVPFPGAILDSPADISLSRTYERLQALLGDDVCAKGADAPVGDEAAGFLDFVESKLSNQEIVERIRGWVSVAKEMARRSKQQMADFLKITNKIRCSLFILSHLEHFDLYALLTRIRNFLAHLACSRVPLFEYGAELCEYRHRFR
ncbi:hypothetical protein EXN22_14815 [Pseudomonas tructae]|uniref:Uncharacterized protein n=1 Tax=Pseudomonas tructae TaxID=2518644 RepID=A0A411MJC9_9PSED|nr:hypothetical protein [Pseudomonas tructae]QBF26898.1 hypothetical protein EXN22_14815 [Pseudomonas tructae]